MGDVAQILGLTGATATGASGTDAVTKELQQLKPTGVLGATKAQKKAKKLTGMQREVVELLESNHRVNHALYPGVSKLTLHQKWKERKDVPAVKWTRKSFCNPARASLAGEQDPATALTLSHWVKAHVSPPEYVFARFNVHCEILHYTDTEYETVLANLSDPLFSSKWTRAETDLLMELCKRFDLRWMIIADQFSTHPMILDSPVPRSVEDLKYRYYEVIRRITHAREENNCSTAEPILAKVDGTVSTSVEHTKVDGTVDGGTKLYRFNVTYEKQRKRQLDLAFVRTMEEEVEIKRLQDELRSVEQELKKVSMKMDPKKKKEMASIPFQSMEQAPLSGVVLRSRALAVPSTLNTKLIKKMEVMLEEMGVPLRPMPTKATCEAYDALRQEMMGLLTLRKHLTTKQTEMEVLKERYETMTATVYERTTTVLPPRKSARRGEAVAVVSSTTGASVGGTETMATPPPISKGKSLKAAEKALQTGLKRRGSTTTTGMPAKRNKKVL